MKPLLSIKDLSVDFGTGDKTSRVVHNLNMDVMPGETVAIVGESGSGKSVTALSIMRLIEQEGGTIATGSITFDTGHNPLDLLKLDAKALGKMRGSDISMVFQEPMTSLNPLFSVGDQLAEVLKLHAGKSHREALISAKHMLDRVRIPEAAARLKQYPHELSGGMRQRVMIAMALMCEPKLLIADEPTTALDVTIQAQILALIDELKRDMNMAILFITHDLGVVAEIAERAVVMCRGHAVEQALVRNIFNSPAHPYTANLIAAMPRLGEGSPDEKSAGNTPVVVVRNLVKRYPVRKGLLQKVIGHIHAVEDISFDLRAGETLALVGESGCGKSTTARALMRLIEPTSGQIQINGRDVTHLNQREIQPLRRNIQMIFQDPYASLNPRLTALDIITEPLVIHEPHLPFLERKDKAINLLRRVGLGEEHLTRYPHQFSGGQRQRLAIARALSLNPKVIIADEPVSALDVSVQDQVLNLMRELQEELGLAYLFVSHDMAVVERMSHRIAVMQLGRIVETGPAKAVLENPQHAYTRSLIASVPIPDPHRQQKMRRVIDVSEIPSPFRPLGYISERAVFSDLGNNHQVLCSV